MARLPDVIDLDGRSHIKALLGPTNTGKTHRAIQRMLWYNSGMIGLPLRLLAREVYDRVCERVGEDKVALVTGEERIVPSSARYFCCTVESMPLSRPVAFLAVDEIQLATHRERGHTFTDRLLNARGVKETWFMGSDTMVPIVERLVPTAEIQTFQRLSQLRYAGVSRLTALRPRSAVVAFSASHVYELAERLRATRGGTAVVLGALSPRARNAQVAMYQAGEVQYLVSTDAIGMGLNLDIHHLALGALFKFDGVEHRPLTAAELGQIAGRAGRFRRDGTFGLTAACAARTSGLDQGIIEAVEQQRFEPVRRVYYRNAELDFSDPDALLHSLVQRPPHRFMIPMFNATDHDTLRSLLRDPEIRARAAGSEAALELLWEVCRVPDFRRTLASRHAALVRSLFVQLFDQDTLNPRWVDQRLKRLDRIDGGVEELMTRIAFIRTWTYVANRVDWLEDRAHWQQRTREIEDRLSDALHELLTQRFVDQRAVVLMDRLESGVRIEAEMSPEGELNAAGVRLGWLQGFTFQVDQAPSAAGAKAVRKAVRQAVVAPLAERVALAVAAPHQDLRLDASGRVCHEDGQLAKLAAGVDVLKPSVRPMSHELLNQRQRDALRRRAQAWVREEVRRLTAPLDAPEGVSPAMVGILYRVKLGLGTLRRRDAHDLIQSLSGAERKALARQDVRVGMHAVYSLPLLKPEMVARRAWLWGVAREMRTLLPPPPASATSVPAEHTADFYEAVGYRLLGSRAVRVDMVERLDAALRGRTREKASPLPDVAMSWLGCSFEELIDVCRALGYLVHGEGDKARVNRPENTHRSKRKRRRPPRRRGMDKKRR